MRFLPNTASFPRRGVYIRKDQQCPSRLIPHECRPTEKHCEDILEMRRFGLIENRFNRYQYCIITCEYREYSALGPAADTYCTDARPNDLSRFATR